MGIEPTTSWATTRCSNQLSYAHHAAFVLWCKGGRNYRSYLSQTSCKVPQRTHFIFACSSLIFSMRLVSRYIIKELILPFTYSLMVIVLMLFINFFLRAIDRFLGKGLNIFTILEYLLLNLAWIIALAVPMAVLIATLMAFGRLSEYNEINAMRSSGISFISILRPALLFGLFICLGLTYFNNYVLPEMNFYARLLQGDIHKKRPGLDIEPGHFINSLPDYSMIILCCSKLMRR